MSTAEPPPDRLALELRRRAQAMRVLGQWLDRDPGDDVGALRRAGGLVRPGAERCSNELAARPRRWLQRGARGPGPR